MYIRHGWTVGLDWAGLMDSRGGCHGTSIGWCGWGADCLSSGHMDGRLIRAERMKGIQHGLTEILGGVCCSL
jgi:hypothetical protein